MREIVRVMAQLFPTAIVSGRGREKVEAFVQLRELFYAGSHGMDIVGPQVRDTPVVRNSTYSSRHPCRFTVHEVCVTARSFQRQQP